MEDAIRDVFPYGPAERIIMYTAAAERKSLHEELTGKIKRGELLVRLRRWAGIDFCSKNGIIAYQIARSKYNSKNFHSPNRTDDECIHWYPGGTFNISLVQEEKCHGKAMYLRPRFHAKDCVLRDKFVRLTRQFLIDYLTENGFKKIKSKSKTELMKLTQSF